jgi:hypothetical protein
MNKVSTAAGNWTTRKPEVKSCVCSHDFQDRRYGVKRRLHVATKPSNPGSSNDWRCTVCGAEKNG